MDNCISESLSRYADYSVSSQRVVDILKNIIAELGKPDFIRVNNDPEAVINHLQAGAKRQVMKCVISNLED